MRTPSRLRALGACLAVVLLAGCPTEPPADTGFPGGLPIERISVGPGGIEGDDRSYGPAISADGRYVAFASDAENLVSGYTNAFSDVFVYDRQSDVLELVSMGLGSANADGESRYPAISADGRYVAFISLADNLVEGDINAFWDIFVRDRQTGVTTLVSKSSTGDQGNDNSRAPSISADGSRIAFESDATNLAGGGAGISDIFMHDTVTGTTVLASADSSGNQGNGGSYEPSLSADGRFVAFYSSASNLVSGDANGFSDVFVRDMQTGAVTMASVSSDEIQGDGGSNAPSISADGRYVAFESGSTNLVSGDTGNTDVFLRDIQAGLTVFASVNAAGTKGNGGSYLPSVSADGRYIEFCSSATNLVSGDTNGFSDVFVRDMQTGDVKIMSISADGMPADDSSRSKEGGLMISGDGRYAAFDSFATNLVAGDSNNVLDVFVAPVR